MYVNDAERRWFEDTDPQFRGRFLELYMVGETAATGQRIGAATVHWRGGRPVGARRTWDGAIATLESKRYRELEGAELARARQEGVRR